MHNVLGCMTKTFLCSALTDLHFAHSSHVFLSPRALLQLLLILFTELVPARVSWNCVCWDTYKRVLWVTVARTCMSSKLMIQHCVGKFSMFFLSGFWGTFQHSTATTDLLAGHKKFLFKALHIVAHLLPSIYVDKPKLFHVVYTVTGVKLISISWFPFCFLYSLVC